MLMERAALAVADAVGEYGDQIRVLSVCGTGNNGADGIAAGRILRERGIPVTLLLAGDPDHGTEEFRLQKQIAEHLGMDIRLVETDAPEDGGQQKKLLWPWEEERYDVVIDALFGIGLSRPVAGELRQLIDRLQSLEEVHVVSVDIPSGIHADTGQVMGTAMKADVTVTFGWEKTGLKLYPGKAYAGQVRIAKIGFPGECFRQAGWDSQILDASDLKRLPGRSPEGNKGTFGRVLVIAGSHGMCGASFLSALAAYRTGAGLVKVLTVPENRRILQTQLPEAIVETYDPETVMPGEEFQTFLEEQCDWADVIVMGPGLGRESYVESLAEMVLAHVYVPLVLDADGLNAVADHPHLTRFFTENIIITPHMGEMARLTGNSVQELKEDPLLAAREYSSRHGVVCVMKDAVTVIADNFT